MPHGPTRAFIAWEVDGAPLPAEEGPLRLIVTTDKEGSRSAYALRTLEVIDLRKR
jgi:DMSO/TMAO reductase YedYZ molybdopterin-dependent catalytic subunit